MKSQRAFLATVVLVNTLLVGCGETDGAGSALVEKWSRAGGPENEFMSLGSWTATDEGTEAVERPDAVTQAT